MCNAQRVFELWSRNTHTGKFWVVPSRPGACGVHDPRKIESKQLKTEGIDRSKAEQNKQEREWTWYHFGYKNKHLQTSSASDQKYCRGISTNATAWGCNEWQGLASSIFCWNKQQLQYSSYFLSKNMTVWWKAPWLPTFHWSFCHAHPLIYVLAIPSFFAWWWFLAECHLEIVDLKMASLHSLRPSPKAMIRRWQWRACTWRWNAPSSEHDWWKRMSLATLILACYPGTA